MDIQDAIAGRRAVREYLSDGVDEQNIRRLIDAAVQAPSAINQQPWVFTVVRDQPLLDRISEKAKTLALAAAPVHARSEPHLAMLDDPDFHIFYHAPALILIWADKSGPWIVEDCALAAENLMLLAHAMDLGSCWIGFAQRYLDTPEGKALLGLPESAVPVAPIIVGHPKRATPAVPRKPPEIHWVG